MNLYPFIIVLPLLLSSLPDAFQQGRYAWLADRGWPYSRLRDEGCLPVLARFEIEVTGDIVPGVPLDVRTWPTRAGRYTYCIKQVASQRGRAVASAEYGLANYDITTEHCRALPAGLRGVLGPVPAGEELVHRGED